MRELVVHNTHAHRFELSIDKQVAFIEYRIESQLDDDRVVYVFVHTKVPESLRGRGIGMHLAEGALEYVMAHGVKVRSECSFISAYLTQHSQYKDLIAD